MKMGKKDTNITSSKPHKIAAPKIVGAAMIAANTGRDFLSGNFGSSISSIISGKMAIKERMNVDEMNSTFSDVLLVNRVFFYPPFYILYVQPTELFMNKKRGFTLYLDFKKGSNLGLSKSA